MEVRFQWEWSEEYGKLADVFREAVCLQAQYIAGLGDETGANANVSQLHVGNFIFLALADVDRDVDVAAVWRDRDLGRFDIELEVARVQVMRAHRFEVGLELLP